jgi:hypothetical protein
MKALSVLVLFALGLVLSTASLRAQGVLSVTNLTRSGTSVTITAQNVPCFPPAALSTAFILEGTTSLENPQWKIVPGVFSAPAGSDTLKTTSTTVTLPAGQPRYFYRVCGILGTTEDPDGDGIPSTIETTVTNTNPALHDANFDGLNDGQAFAYRDPVNSSASPPVFGSSLPAANFRLADSTATEGAPPHQLEVVFDRVYLGTLNYAISALSSTVAGTDYTLAGGSPTATTGSDAYQLVILTRPNWSATVFVYDS